MLAPTPLHALPLAPTALRRARLPAWALPQAWPCTAQGPALADVHLHAGRIAALRPHAPTEAPPQGAWDVAGAPVLPGLVDAHTHLDKTFTLERMGSVRPGLLGAIEAMMADRAAWTPEDVRTRAGQGLQWAWEAGVVHLRTHCDWWEAERTPLAWEVLAELAQAWAPHLRIERVSLMPLPLFADRQAALRLAATVAASGPGAVLGGFVHTTHWDEQALRHLLEAAQHHDLAVDLHMDEELAPQACGLAATARWMRELGFARRVVCGHACALSAQPEAVARDTLDAVARVPITLVTLPVTNLLLQDAVTGRTPRQRGITLVKEARARGIPVLLASDNVQDPFCPLGSYDPLEALGTGVAAAQLTQAFDQWTDSVCRSDWLQAPGASPPPLQPGSPADLLVFPRAQAGGFPSRSDGRVVLRAGTVVQGAAPGARMQCAAPTEALA